MKTALKIFSVAAIGFACVTLASSSPATPPVQPPQNYTGKLTHGDFVSCDGQLLNPPAYAVSGTWVLRIDRNPDDLIPPTAQLTLLVFRDNSKYLLFPNIDLTPISVQNGVYTYTFGPQVTVTLDTNTHPATFSWGVQFSDNCTVRTYRSLAYVGTSNQ